jgi:hypothetical protein
MKTESPTKLRLAAAAVGVTLAMAGLAGCSGDVDPVSVAQAQVTSAEKAVTEAQAAFTDASDTFCKASETYITGLDRYGDVLNDTEPTVGDVKVAGADLAKPRDRAFDGAQAAVDAHDTLVAAQQELYDAQVALEEAKAGPTGTPTPVPPLAPATPLVPTATVDRVEQAEDEFETAQSAVTDDTPLAFASEQFNSAAVALEVSWLRLFSDAGCLPDEQQAAAVAAVSTYTATLQQSLTDAGYYAGAIDGVYGPDTVAAVEALQTANGLPVTGTMDKASEEALQEALAAVHGAASQQAVAATAALQQTLKLVGYWDGPVDGMPSAELTAALQEFQTALGVEPTGAVDAATIAAFQQAISDLVNPPAPEPSPSPSETPAP